MAFFSPQTQFREIAVVPQHTVLLFVDVQNFNCHRGGTLYKTYQGQGKTKVRASLAPPPLLHRGRVVFPPQQRRRDMACCLCDEEARWCAGARA